MVLKPCGRDAARAFIKHLQLFSLGFSWGGFESLIVPFDPRTEREASTWQHAGPAFRLHIGLEAVDDLKADLACGLRQLNIT
jgi:cystathionine beta-lyase